MSLSGNKITLSRTAKVDEEGFGKSLLRTFAKAEQEAWIEAQKAKSGGREAPQTTGLSGTIEYEAPKGYDSHLDHFRIFFRAMLGGEPVLENAAYGFRAAAPALIANLAYRENRIVDWDPEAMKLT
jgi:hypothetical protein